MNSDHKPHHKLGQSDLVYWVDRSSQKILIKLYCQLRFTARGLLVMLRFPHCRLFMSVSSHVGKNILQSRKTIIGPTSGENIYYYNYYWWRRGVAVESRTRDQEVAGSSLGRALRRKNSGQVSHTYVPLSPSSITWYWPKGGDA